MFLQLLGQCSACLAYIHSGAATAGDPVDYSCLLLKRDPVLQIDQCLSQRPVWSEAGTNLQRGEDAPDGFRFSARCHGTSAWAPRNFRAGRHGFCAGGRGSSAQMGTNLPCRFGLKMAETRRRTSCATTLKDQETRRKDHSKYHYRNRTCYLFRTESADCPCRIL